MEPNELSHEACRLASSERVIPATQKYDFFDLLSQDRSAAPNCKPHAWGVFDDSRCSSELFFGASRRRDARNRLDKPRCRLPFGCSDRLQELQTYCCSLQVCEEVVHLEDAFVGEAASGVEVEEVGDVAA